MAFLKSSFDRKDINRFLIAFISLCVIYFGMLTAWLTNPDGFWNGLLFKNGSDWENKIGRFGLTPIYLLHNYIVSPAMATFVSFFFLAVIAVLIVRIFDPNCLWKSLLITFSVLLAPNVVTTLTYYYCSDAYFFAYLLSVLAILILWKGHGIRNWVIATVLLTYSLSCYQAYITVTGTLGLLIIASMCFDEKVNRKEIAGFIKRSIACTIASVGLYFVIFKCIKVIFHYEDVGKITFAPLSQIPGLIVQSYKMTIQYFFTNGFLYNDWAGRKYWNAAFFVFVLVFGLYKIVKGKAEISRKILGVFFLILLPIACFGIAIIAPSANIYGETGLLMMPAVNYLYLTPMIFKENSRVEEGSKKLNSLKAAIHIVIHGRILILILSSVLAFQGYVQMNLNQMASLSGELVAQIETVRQKEGNLPIAFIGDLEKPRLHNVLIDPVYGTIAEYGMTWSSTEGRQESWKNFILHSVGYDYEVVPAERYEELCGTAEATDLPLFPAHGSVARIHDVIVVKLGNPAGQ